MSDFFLTLQRIKKQKNMRNFVQSIAAYVFMVMSTIAPLCAQEYIRAAQTLVADTAYRHSAGVYALW